MKLFAYPAMVAAILLTGLPASAEISMNECAGYVKTGWGVNEGEFEIVAEPPMVVLELPQERLKFEDNVEFVKYMMNSFNASPVFDDSGEMVTWDLAQLVVGTPIYFDGENWVEAEDPVGVMVGGVDGYVEVGGTLVCVNESLCGSPGLGLMAMAAPTSSLSAAGFPTLGCSGALSGPLCVETKVLAWNALTKEQKLNHKVRDMRARWVLVPDVGCAGPYLRLEYYVPDNFLGQLTYNFKMVGFMDPTTPYQAPLQHIDALSWIYQGGGLSSRKPALGSTMNKGELYECMDGSCWPRKAAFCIDNYHRPSACPPY